MSNKDNRKSQKRNLLLICFVAATLIFSGCGSKASQSGEIFTIGVVNPTVAFEPILDGFKAGMEDMGYVEGQNIIYIYNGPIANSSEFEAVLENLKTENVDLVLTFGTFATLQAKEILIGTDIPIIFGPVTDPIESRIVRQLQQPGGNITGIQTGNPTSERVEWLLRIVPEAQRIYVLHNPDDNSSTQALVEVKQYAPILGVEFDICNASAAAEIEACLDGIPDNIDAIFLLASALFESNIDKFVAFANANKIPLASPATANVRDGALISFGHDNVPLGRQAAQMADQIFNGTHPSTIPVESAELFVSVNLKAAEIIGLDISDAVLEQIDIVVDE